MTKLAGYNWVRDTFLSNHVATSQMAQAIARTTSKRMVLPLRKQVADGEVRVVWMGDSDVEGTGAESRHARFCELVIEQMRSLWPIAGGDTGLGYTPVKYFTFWGFPEQPVITGNYLEVPNGGGLGNRSINMQSPACTVTFPAQPVRYLRVHYTARPETAYSGTFQVRNGTGGPILMTIDTLTSGTEESNYADYDFGSAASRTIVLEWVSGNPRPEGIAAQTSLTGITGFEAARAGAKVGDYGTLGLIQGGNPDSANRHWEAVWACNPTLGFFAFGRNDQASYTELQWRNHLIDVCERWFQDAPDAPLIFIMSPARVADVDDDPQRINRFESILLEVSAQFPLMSCIFESMLWAPRSGIDYSQGDPFGWFAGFGDTTHKSKVAHQLLADHITATISSLGTNI